MREITFRVVLLHFDYHAIQQAVLLWVCFSPGCHIEQAIKVNSLLCIHLIYLLFAAGNGNRLPSSKLKVEIQAISLWCIMWLLFADYVTRFLLIISLMTYSEMYCHTRTQFHEQLYKRSRTKTLIGSIPVYSTKYHYHFIFSSHFQHYFQQQFVQF